MIHLFFCVWVLDAGNVPTIGPCRKGFINSLEKVPTNAFFLPLSAFICLRRKFCYVFCNCNSSLARPSKHIKFNSFCLFAKLCAPQNTSKCASKSLGFHSNLIFCVPKPPKKKQLLNQNRYIRTDASKYDFWMHSGAILPSPNPEIGVATAHQPSECLVDHMSRFTTRSSLVPCYGGIRMGESCQCIQFLHVTRKCSSKCITWRELFQIKCLTLWEPETTL